MQSVAFEKVEYRSLNEIAYEQIKQKIIDNELPPGEKLDVGLLCESLGVSRTPVIHALRELTQKGYVLINPRSGSYVREHTREEIEYIFDFREVMEELIARKIVDRLDPAFLRPLRDRLAALRSENPPSVELLQQYFEVEMELHQYMLRLCPPIVSDKLENLVDLTKRLRKLHLRYLMETRGRVDFANEEIRIHVAIADALLAGDAGKAARLLVRDIRTTRDQILEDYEAIEEFARGAVVRRRNT